MCGGTRTDFEVHACTASSPHIKKNSFHKLIRVIRIFMRKFLRFNAIHEILLTLNYFRTTVSCGSIYCWHSLLPVDKRNIMWNLPQSIAVLWLLSCILYSCKNNFCARLSKVESYLEMTAYRQQFYAEKYSKVFLWNA